jgi:hypothetical protein
MSKILNTPIQVKEGNGLPLRFFWNKRWISIESIDDVWPLTGRWWLGEPKKVFYRVNAGGNLFELLTDGSGKWRLYKVYE